MTGVVSIIHGARRINGPRHSPPDWPQHLADYLKARGFAEARPFYWSGEVWDGFAPVVARRYARALHELATDFPNHNLYILGKSLGAVIAEFALHHLERDGRPSMRIHRLIRLGCPDRRRPFQLPLVDSVMNIVSSSDVLARVCGIPLTLALHTLCRRPPALPGQWTDLWLSGITHADFNHPRPLRWPLLAATTLYELYADAMGEGAICSPGEPE